MPVAPGPVWDDGPSHNQTAVNQSTKQKSLSVIMLIQKIAAIVGLTDGANATEETVLQAVQQHVDSNVLRAALLEIFGMNKSTVNRSIIERVRKLESEDAARVGGPD